MEGTVYLKESTTAMVVPREEGGRREVSAKALMARFVGVGREERGRERGREGGGKGGEEEEEEEVVVVSLVGLSPPSPPGVPPSVPPLPPRPSSTVSSDLSSRPFEGTAT